MNSKWSITAPFMATLVHGFGVLAAAIVMLLGATDNSIRAEERMVRIVALGDSLMARSRLPADAYPFSDRLEFALKAKGHLVAIANAGVGGNTAAHGLARLGRAVPAGTDAVILELGWWDMTSGLDPKVTSAALAAILSDLKARNVVVLLCGVRPRTNFGAEHEQAFAAMFAGLASEYNVLFYPAFDDAFVDDSRLKTVDGLHPNAAGIEELVTRILPHVEALIDRARRRDG